MTQTTESSVPVRGAYLVDTAAADERDGCSVAIWTGRMRHVDGDGLFLLVSARGYEWPVAPAAARPANAAECEAYERNRTSDYLVVPAAEPGGTRHAP